MGAQQQQGQEGDRRRWSWPPARRGNEFAMSNWIDNPNLACKNLNREKSTQAIEACKTQRDVINLMNPDQSKYFGFNFMNLETYKTIEFRRGAASSNVTHVFMWVEFAMTFLQASIQASNISAFKKFQPTVGGLKKFFATAAVVDDPGMNQPNYLKPLFKDHKDDERVEPTPVLLKKLSKEKRDKLKQKIEADKKSNPMLERISDATRTGVI
jgi:hypothetical protein